MNDFLQLRVKKIVKETEDAFTYFFEPVENTVLNYKSGQFLTLIFKKNEKEVRRSYSIISSTGVDADLAITIKRMVNGELSRYLIDHLGIGDVIQSLYPTGRFTVDPGSQQKRTFFFLAAGGGITPVYSLIKTVLYEEPVSNVILIYSNVSEATTIFYGQIKSLGEQFPSRLKCIFLFSRSGQRLNNIMLENLVNQHLSSENLNEFYFCGPYAYMRMITLTLIYMGFKKEQLHKENFISEQLPQSTEVLAERNTAAHVIHIVYAGKNYELTVPPHQTILDAALEKNILLPYSCKAGLCSACAAICKAGKVGMINNEVLTDKDISEGWVLTCTGFPLEDDTVINFETE